MRPLLAVPCRAGVVLLAAAAALATLPVSAHAAAPLRFSQRPLGQVDGTPFDLAVGKFASPSPDVAVAVNRGVFERGGVQLLLNSRGSFVFGPLVLGGETPYSIDIGDVDGDGDLDAAEPNTVSDDVTVYTNRFGNLAAAPGPAAPYFTRGIAVADFNGDGREDIATTSRDQPNGSGALLVFYRSASGGGFDPVVRVAPASPAEAFDALEALAAADLNGDGLTDVVGAAESENRIVVSYRKPNNGGFAPVTTLSPVAGGPFDVAAGDLNRDGRTDLAVASLFTPKVAVLLRRRNRPGFRSPRYLDVTAGSSHVVIADLNGDRRNDVAVSLLEAAKVAVIPRRSSNKGFGRAKLVDAGPFPLALGALDAEGDGDTDLVVGNRDSHEIRLLLNRRR